MARRPRGELFYSGPISRIIPSDLKALQELEQENSSLRENTVMLQHLSITLLKALGGSYEITQLQQQELPNGTALHYHRDPATGSVHFSVKEPS